MSLISVYIVAVSAVGLVFLFSRRFKEVKVLTEAELKDKLAESKPVFYDINQKIIFPTIYFVHDYLMPKVYKEFEIIISKLRISLLKAERLLLQLTHYVRGKREVRKNGNAHPYWDNFKGDNSASSQEKDNAESEQDKSA